MDAYLWMLLAGALVSAALFAWRLERAGMKKKAALWALPLCVLMGTATARAVYFVSLCTALVPRYGLAGLWHWENGMFSFAGGALGVCVGAALAARCCRLPVGKALNAFAPAGACMAAFAWFGQYWQGLQGVGEYVENEALCFFPLAVKNEWDEWFFAVFMLAGLAALAVCIAGCARKPGPRDFVRTVFYLALPQILCESLRAQGMRWGFVRVEQVYCAVICVTLLARGCRLYGRGLPPVGRWWPVAAAAAGIGVLVCVEFILGGKLIRLETWVCHVITLAVLIGFAGLEMVTEHRARGAKC